MPMSKWKECAKVFAKRLGTKKLDGPQNNAYTHADTKKSTASEHFVSPLAPKGGLPDLATIKGVEFACGEAKIKYQNRKDVTLIRLSPGTVIAGAFTRSSTRSASVRDCQEKLAIKNETDQGSAILINSGNANAFTGKAGEEAVNAISNAVAQVLNIPAARVFTSSTGVIGEPLAYEKITKVLCGMVSMLNKNGAADAARAIMTTDTFPKGASTAISAEGGSIQITGIAKGSGMIAPDMATMLVYIFTDAKITADALQKIVSRKVIGTFNSITVDSDTSTSDTLLVAATGQSSAAPLQGASLKDFEKALEQIMQNLALQVIRDGEGASKLIEVNVSGAKNQNDAAKVAFSIANSPLIKTAVAGSDPNWGRIIAAIGKSGAEVDRDKITIHFGDVLVAKDGWRYPHYKEEDGAAHFKGDEIKIRVALGLGRAKRTVWGCDFTETYIKINADYRS